MRGECVFTWVVARKALELDVTEPKVAIEKSYIKYHEVVYVCR
jgi:hypothetical protein